MGLRILSSFLAPTQIFLLASDHSEYLTTHHYSRGQRLAIFRPRSEPLKQEYRQFYRQCHMNVTTSQCFLKVNFIFRFSKCTRMELVEVRF